MTSIFVCLFVIQVPGSEWALFKLGHVGRVHSIEVDTNHFKGNFPDSVKIEGILASDDQDPGKYVWKTIMSPKKVSLRRKLDSETEEEIYTFRMEICSLIRYCKPAVSLAAITPPTTLLRIRRSGILWSHKSRENNYGTGRWDFQGQNDRVYFPLVRICIKCVGFKTQGHF